MHRFSFWGRAEVLAYACANTARIGSCRRQQHELVSRLGRHRATHTNTLDSVSPSVYVFITSLNAQNLCGPVGGKYPIEVLSYRPYELSTSTLATSFSGLGPALGQWTKIDYADFDSP